jgi:hypothetical protein
VRVELEAPSGSTWSRSALAPGRRQVIRLDGQVVRAHRPRHPGRRRARRAGRRRSWSSAHRRAAGRSSITCWAAVAALRADAARVPARPRAAQRAASRRRPGAVRGPGTSASWRSARTSRRCGGGRCRRSPSTRPTRTTRSRAKRSGFDVAPRATPSTTTWPPPRRETRVQERARGATVVGPHRDELRITLSDRLVQTFGSRGEARTAALALRVAERALLEARHGARRSCSSSTTCTRSSTSAARVPGGARRDGAAGDRDGDRGAAGGRARVAHRRGARRCPYRRRRPRGGA